MSDKETLLSMGFAPERIECKLIFFLPSCCQLTRRGTARDE